MKEKERVKNSRKLLVSDTSTSDISTSEEGKKPDNKRLKMRNPGIDDETDEMEIAQETHTKKKEPVGALIITNIELNKEIEWGAWFKSTIGDSKTTVKFTRNKNILIFPETENEYEYLNGRKVTINDNSYELNPLMPKTPELVLKGLSFDQAQVLKEELEKLGLTDIKQMKSFANPEITLKKVRISCKSQQDLETFIKAGIKINYQKFYFETYRQKEINIIQCFNCQALGHIAINCNRKKNVLYVLMKLMSQVI